MDNRIKKKLLAMVLPITLLGVVSFAPYSNNYVYAHAVENVYLEAVPDCVSIDLDEVADDYIMQASAIDKSTITAKTNLAFNKKVTCSSIEKGTNLVANNVVDGNATTRWASEEKKNNPEWINIDLGSNTIINKVDIKWEAAYAKAFNIEVSCDGKTYKEVASVTNNQNTSTSNKFASVEARYVRVYCTKKATKYGYSIYEVSVYNERPTMENVNLAVNKQATCSSVEYGTDHIAKNAVDGTRQTRWASEEFKDNPEWLQVDLGCVMTINEVYINWEAAYAKAFNVEVSCDGKTYTKVAKVSNNTLLDTYIKFDVVDARYVRVNCTKKATKYGYSIYEFGVYNSTQVIDQIEVTDEEKELLDLVNKVRREEGLCELRFNSELRKCAMLKAQDMVDNGYFDHESPTYGSPFDMMKKFGISYRSAGENIAGARSVERAFELWMNSPGHRANILKESFNQVGFGIVNSPKYGKMLVQQFIGV